MRMPRFGLALMLMSIGALAGCAASPAVPPDLAAHPGVVLFPLGRPVPDAGAGKASTAPSLIGLATGEVQGLLGHPRFVRRDGPAQLWQYGTKACTLNLFFYPEDAVLKVRHFELRDRNATLAPAGGCDGGLASLVFAPAR
jgi:hypothetical protein